MTRRNLANLIAALALSLGCEDTSGPADPVWGKQSCGHCRMVVSDPRFAAQLLTPTGERTFFDDVGCLVEHLDRAPARHAWVSAGAGVWLELSRARFGKDASTPMDYGFVVEPAGELDFAAVQRGVKQRRQESRR
jgi:hypothetical protein